MIDTKNVGKALIVAPHPDDEVLGCGGTISRMVSDGARVEVAIVTRGKSTLGKEPHAGTSRAEAPIAHAKLGVAKTHFLDFPAAFLDTVPHADVNAAIGKLVQNFAPDTVFVPFPGDMHRDHFLVFESTLVACRPNKPDYPRTILAYETLSETNWHSALAHERFDPTVFVDISNHLEAKIEAMEIFASQIKAFPCERSLRSLQALAELRGSTVFRRAAEGFALVRAIS